MTNLYPSCSQISVYHYKCLEQMHFTEAYLCHKFDTFNKQIVTKIKTKQDTNISCFCPCTIKIHALNICKNNVN